ncbi:MAG: FecR domain-containing protein [Lentisphaerales bacterium]|nr:FecR domain-containing protein [Lentisphaerales bacterium]
MSENEAIKKLEELLPVLLEEGLSDAQKSELSDLLASDKAAREYYDNYIDTHIALDWHFAGNSLELPSGLECEITVKQQPKKFPVVSFLLSVAALIIIGVMLSVPKTSGDFRLTNTVSAVWEGEALRVGDSLAKSKLKIKSGYGEFVSAGGVKLVVEGPADLDLVSEKKVILNKGKLVAYVPDKNSGFKVDTPKTEVLDLGTEFGVSVEENGDTEIHVLEGQVETSTKGKKALVNKSEAKVYSSGKTVLGKADAGRFMRILPERTPKKVSYIHWPFNEGEGQDTAYIGKNLPEKDFNGYLKSTYKSGPLPKWIEGKFGKAIDFDATGGFLETDYPGIGGANARTVSFWVKVPKDAIATNAISMLAWGSYEGKGKTWQVTWNWRQKDGNMGALRAGLFHGQIVGTKDLRDGEWHHVAIVMFGGNRPNVNTHILLYVDGELEPASRKSILDVQTDIQSDRSLKVIMGRNAMSYLAKKDKQNVFNGSMDEVYIFDCALDENQIRSLMNYNKSGLE